MGQTMKLGTAKETAEIPPKKCTCPSLPLSPVQQISNKVMLLVCSDIPTRQQQTRQGDLPLRDAE